MANVTAVEGNGAALHIVEAKQQARQRGLARAGGADHRHRVARRNGKTHLFEDRPARVVTEADRIEPHFAAIEAQRLGIRAIDDFTLFLQQIEHVLHVDQRPAHLGINKAEEVQRLIQLQQVGVDQHEVADRHRPLRNALRRHGHHHDQPDRNNGGLPVLIAVKLNWFLMAAYSYSRRDRSKRSASNSSLPKYFTVS